ncbi:MAG: sigma-70 family RNA polymerase sigma factor [Cyclobacteriaceae bacterium]
MNYLSAHNHHHLDEQYEPTETALDNCSDTLLWEQFRQGNKAAFDCIYDRLFQTLCSYGDKICDDKSLVEDTIQDLFIYLWTKRTRLGKTNAIKFYLFRCLRRNLIRAMSREKKRPDPFSVVEKYHCHFQLSLKKSSAPAFEENELRDKLTRALHRLTDRQKEAIYLKFYNNLSFQEVAAVMEIEVRSVYNLIGRTIDILRADVQHFEVPASTLLIPFILSFLLEAI